MMKTMEKLSNELLNYGEFLKCIDTIEVDGLGRIRIVKYDGKLYYHHMINGEVKEIDCIGME